MPAGSPRRDRAGFVPDDVRRAFTARLLDPVRDYDRRHRAELIPTLEAFLDCDGSWTRCAARLHLHVNTLRYRVGRIEQLTSRDLSRLEDKLDFFLALRMNGHRGGAGKTLRKKVSPPARRW
jgi:DNA-binding PucR family transcriptional regulator